MSLWEYSYSVNHSEEQCPNQKLTAGSELYMVKRKKDGGDPSLQRLLAAENLFSPHLGTRWGIKKLSTAVGCSSVVQVLASIHEALKSAPDTKINPISQHSLHWLFTAKFGQLRHCRGSLELLEFCILAWQVKDLLSGLADLPVEGEDWHHVCSSWPCACSGTHAPPPTKCIGNHLLSDVTFFPFSRPGSN